MQYITLVPAYGRDYKSAKAAKADWTAGKDFIIACFSDPNDGRYINHQDASNSHTAVSYMLRYERLTKICALGAYGGGKP